MRILFTGPKPWNHPIPYHIAPQRIVRACMRAGHLPFNIDGYGDPYRTAGLPPIPPNTAFQTEWGMSIHVKSEDYYKRLKETIAWFKPDLAYVWGWINYRKEIKLLKARGTPHGFHRADPFWYAPKGIVQYPSKREIAFYKEANFFTANEGQAWNYLRQHGMEGKVHLLSHAIDPYLAPTLNEVKNTEKRFLCSVIMGGEDPYRRLELLKYYYQWTDCFPKETFIIGGGAYQGATYEIDEKGNRTPLPAHPFTEEDLMHTDILHSSQEDIENFADRCFNTTKIVERGCGTLPTKQNPAVLCHRFIHRLYSQSLYGFTPYGWYITHGPQSEYQTGPLGTKTTEMGGSGAAMIANRIKGIEEVITDGKTGFIMDKPEDTKAIFQYAVDNPEEVREMGEEAYRDIHKRHSWDARYREVLLPIFRDLGLM